MLYTCQGVAIPYSFNIYSKKGEIPLPVALFPEGRTPINISVQ